MAKKVRLLLVLLILVAASAVASTVLSHSTLKSDKIAEGAGFKGANQAGMKIYRQSERADYWGVPSRVIQEGLAIYHESERNPSSPGSVFSKEPDLAIYLESERSSDSVQSVDSREEGMAIYRASERYTTRPEVRLHYGKPFNLYKRSEWLGSDR